MSDTKFDFTEITNAGWKDDYETNLPLLDDAIWTRRRVVLGEDVAAYRMVRMAEDELWYYAKASPQRNFPAQGMTLSSGSAGETVTIQRVGAILNRVCSCGLVDCAEHPYEWQFIIGRVCYLSPDTPGYLTQSRPVKRIQAVGVATAANGIFLEGMQTVFEYGTTTSTTTTSTTTFTTTTTSTLTTTSTTTHTTTSTSTTSTTSSSSSTTTTTTA